MGHSGAQPVAGGQGAVPSEQIRAQLENLFASPPFRASKRCQELLRFLVEMTLDGRAGELKERTIAVEVFGRPPAYDPGTDSTVRVKASDLRRRLAQYYSSHSAAGELAIELPPGSYVPQFRHTARPVRRARVLPLAASLVLFMAVVAGLVWRSRAPSDSVLRRFWGAGPVAISLPVASAAPGGELVRATDSSAALAIGSALSKAGVGYRLEAGVDLSRTERAVLIGDPGGRARGLRYGVQGSWITEGGAPTAWSAGYAFVARLFDRRTRRTVVLVSGTDRAGTEAAARFLGDEARLARALSNAPVDWPRRNFEMVLNGGSGNMEVVASRFW